MGSARLELHRPVERPDEATCTSAHHELELDATYGVIAVPPSRCGRMVAITVARHQLDKGPLMKLHTPRCGNFNGCTSSMQVSEVPHYKKGEHIRFEAVPSQSEQSASG